MSIKYITILHEPFFKIGFPKQAVGSFTMVFRARKVFGTFEKRAPAGRKADTFRLTGEFDMWLNFY